MPSALDGSTASAAPPNVVMIISDDQAWGDYGFMGHAQLETPHLDRLAAESLTFHRGYTPTPLCRPALASIITGLYPHQHGVTGNDPALPDRGGFPRASRAPVRLPPQVPPGDRSPPDQADGGPDGLKMLVDTCHGRGFAVVLDVVYNHTAEGNHLGPTLSFKGLENRVYYMLENGGQHYRNYTGCGNTLNGNHPIVRELIFQKLSK